MADARRSRRATRPAAAVDRAPDGTARTAQPSYRAVIADRRRLLALACTAFALVAACSADSIDVTTDDGAPASTTTAPPASATTLAPATPATGATTSTTPQPAATSDPEALFGPTWVAVEATDAGAAHPLRPGTRVFVEFEHRDSGDVVRWSGGCNTVGGEVEVTSDRLLVADELAGTAVGCGPDAEAQDSWVGRLLSDDPVWSLDAGSGRLTLAGTTVDAALVLAAESVSPPPPGCVEPGTETDVEDEPDHRADYLRRWARADGCPVRFDVLVTRVPPPDFHCQGWPPELAMGTPLGARTPDTPARIYVRDPEGFFGDPALQAGFARLPAPPPGATDTGYRQGDTQLWMDPDDDTFVYLVAPDGTERWPKHTHVVGCA